MGNGRAAARSRFIDELPAEHIEVVTEQGLGNVAGWAAQSQPGRPLRHPAGAAPGTRRAPAAGRRPSAIARKQPGAAARPGSAAGRRVLRSATGSSTRNSAMEGCARSRTTSWRSISSTPATRRSWTPSSSAPDPSLSLRAGRQAARQSRTACTVAARLLRCARNDGDDYAGRRLLRAAWRASIASQIFGEMSLPSSRAISCDPVGEVTLISVM